MSENEMPNADLPDEVIRDILSRLPVKSLLQFRCVSKHWRDLIADTHFVKSQLKKSLALSSTHKQILVPSFTLLSLSYNSNTSPDNISTSVELDCPFLKPIISIKILGSCNGLVCLIDGTEDVFIYNPSTRRHSKPYQSPKQYYSNEIKFVYGFGWGSSPDDMRVVRFPRFARDAVYIRFKVYGVASGSGSRVSGVLAYDYDFTDTAGTFLNGSLHWLARHSSIDDKKRVIAAFNVGKETFRDLSLPPEEGIFPPHYDFGVLKGCLSALCHDPYYYTHVDVWLMKEYGVVNSWTKFIKIPCSTWIEDISYMKSLSSLNDDEILLEVGLKTFVLYNVVKKTCGFVVYNVEKNTFRHVTTAHDLKWFKDVAIYVESLISPEVLFVSY